MQKYKGKLAKVEDAIYQVTYRCCIKSTSNQGSQQCIRELCMWLCFQFHSPFVEQNIKCQSISITSPPGKRESLYLTEGGREAFDQLYRLLEGEMRVVSSSTPSPILLLPLDSQTQLVSDLLNMLIGVASTTFPLNQVRFIILI